MSNFSHLGYSRDCPVELIFAIVGKRWKVRVLFQLSRGSKRFSELSARLDGISDKVLSTALRELERDGLISRHVFAEVPPRVEYRITEAGREIWHGIEPLRTWALRYRSAG